MVVEVKGDDTKSELARTIDGRSNIDRLDLLPCWACTEAAACFIKEDVDSDFCNMTSDMLRFFRIGFLCRNELVFDKRLDGSEVWFENDDAFIGCCRGP